MEKCKLRTIKDPYKCSFTILLIFQVLTMIDIIYQLLLIIVKT